MPEAASLFAAIASNPEDDLPRLVYADWLDEHGHPERAEFIRLQCHSARVGPLDPSWAPAKVREFELFKANEAVWRPGKRDDVSFMHMTRWRRGFPACIDLGDMATGRFASGEWCNGAFHWAASPGGRFDPWPQVGPVREVRFSGWRPGCGELLWQPRLRGVRSLSLMEWYAGVNPGSVENFAGELAQLPPGHFPDLAALDLNQGELNLPALEALAVAPAVRALTRLSLRFPEAIRPATMPYWVEATRGLFAALSGRVERLELNGLPPELVPAFGGITWAELRGLSVWHLHAAGLGVYGHADTPKLETLSISHFLRSRDGGPVVPNPLEAFGDGWPSFDRLKALSLGRVPAESLRWHLEAVSRLCPTARLEFLAAFTDPHDRPAFRLPELADFPWTRELKGLAGEWKGDDLTALADPAVMPELHTVWGDDPEPAGGMPWRCGTRTVIPKDEGSGWQHPPTRGQWCGWHERKG